ncbi:uncharacterized protein LOC119736715 [Patiria miniata]|uniref:Uncharacterized protein n=1 Tax=Patiria miniata TaxID=46514 RepID=A0A914ATI8_PATMI|nr:uncharacterized protein LOC119736715 [Patiria miniata]
MCYNGGVCDDKTGYCICPPGFSGANCFTEPDPFGISCINGYSGLTCSDVCTSGRFGAGCEQECHCLLPDLDCDRYTGVCHVGGCADGWSGANCQIPDICQVGYYGSNCLRKCHCLGDAACDKYTGYCSVGCAPGFICVSRQCEAGYFGEDCSTDCHCLDDAACDGITGSCPSGRCLGDQFQTDGTGICKFVLPVLSQSPDVSVNYTSAVVTWKPWGSHPMDSGDGPIMGYKIYHSNYSSSSSTRADYLAVISETPSSFRFEIESLQQLSVYNFSVAAVREGEGGEGPRSPVTTIRTQPRASHTDFLDTKDSLHLTMATHFFHRAGESNIIRLACYRSSPDTDADLSFGRLPVHLPGAGIDSSTSFPDGTTSGEFDGLKFTQLPINNVNATGLYYCEGSKGGQTTRVYSSIYSNNGWYYPGRWNALLLTKTINTGENATLSVQNRRGWTSHASWRRISDGVATNLTDYDGMGTITIPASQAKHGDVYVVLSSRYSLRDNKFSLFRLIVRGCVASKWGPPACDGVCDLCYNGGVCDDETGDCICPPGFMGPNCLTVCPIGSFGWACGYKCGSGQLNSCAFSQFGLPDPFGISCINGHRGYECRYLCSSGSFGAGCLQECHCLSADECNRYTGVCTNRSCAEGWSGTNCQIPDTCPVGYYGLNCLSKCHCLGDAACDKYTGYCNVGCAPGFTCVSWQCEAGYFGGDCSKECHCLDDATCDRITGFCPSKKCIAPFQTDGTGICQSVPPVLSQPPEVRVKSTSAIVTWKAWGSHPLDAGDGPIVGYKIYHSNYSSISLTSADYISAIYQPPSSFIFDIESLQQLTVYYFSVAAVREEEGGEGPRSPVTTIRTQPQDTTQDRVLALPEHTT